VATASTRRFQYPGAIYHVMARGDGGKTVFDNPDDCAVLLNQKKPETGETLG
jgi:hypothetical protein